MKLRYQVALTPEEQEFANKLKELNVPERKMWAIVGYSRVVSQLGNNYALDLLQINLPSQTEEGKYQIMNAISQYFSKVGGAQTAVSVAVSELHNGSFELYLIPVTKPPTYDVEVAKAAVHGISPMQGVGKHVDPVAVSKALGVEAADIAMSAAFISPITLYRGGKLVKEGIETGSPMLAFAGLTITGLEVASPGPFLDWAVKPIQKAIWASVRSAVREGLTKTLAETARRGARELTEKEVGEIASVAIEKTTRRLQRELSVREKESAVRLAMQSLGQSEEAADQLVVRFCGETESIVAKKKAAAEAARAARAAPTEIPTARLLNPNRIKQAFQGWLQENKRANQYLNFNFNAQQDTTLRNLENTIGLKYRPAKRHPYEFYAIDYRVAGRTYRENLDRSIPVYFDNRTVITAGRVDIAGQIVTQLKLKGLPIDKDVLRILIQGTPEEAQSLLTHLLTIP